MNWTQWTTLAVNSLQASCGSTTTTAFFVIVFFSWFALMMNFDRGAIILGAIGLFTFFASIGYIGMSVEMILIVVVGLALGIMFLRMMGD